MADRQVKVAEMIAHEAATYIAAEANTDPMITVTRADVSPDLRNATIFFTTLPEGKEEGALIFLKRNGTEMRRSIMKKAHIKIIPHLDFAVDYGERHRQHIDEIVREQGIESTYPEMDEGGK